MEFSDDEIADDGTTFVTQGAYGVERTPLLTPRKKQTEEAVIQEYSIKSTVLVVILSTVLGAANCYLGLFAGMTISVSIPSAILSLALLKPFNPSILEINMLQAGSSAGASLVAGVVYTLPALLLMGYWDEFQYWETTMITLIGGVMGILFSVPLRRILVVENELPFPEGVATAEVLKATMLSPNKTPKVLLIVSGIVAGIFIKLSQAGFMFWSESFQGAWFISGVVLYIGCNLSPALVAVGYIMKLKICFLLFVGGMLNWWVAIPILSSLEEPNGESALDLAERLWDRRTRYIGVGAMLLGGLGTVLNLAGPLWRGVKSAAQAYLIIRRHGFGAINRTDRDIPLPFIVGSVIFLVVPICIIYTIITSSFWVGLFMTGFVIVAGFLFSAVGAYMAGMVGSSNNPISGVTLATIIVASMLLLPILGWNNPKGPPAAIMIGAVVCCAAAISGDNMQDLKAGHLLGSTPLLLQLMQIIGIIAPSLVISPVLKLLIEAYGIGDKTDLHPHPLPAPQASLMKAVTESIFFWHVPWEMIVVGVSLAFLFVLIDFLTYWKFDFRIPVLSIALGLYLPLGLATPIFLGGLVAYLGKKTLQSLKVNQRICNINENNGLLFAAGLITGEATVGILIAIPIVITGRVDVLAFAGSHTDTSWPGLVLLALITVVLYVLVVQILVKELLRDRSSNKYHITF